MEKRKIGFVGGGRITKIMMEGLRKADYNLKEAIVFDPNSECLIALKKGFAELITTSDSLDNFTDADVIFVAVHPPMVVETLEKIKPFLKDTAVVVSLAPKITIAKMQMILPNIQTIVRVNPSAPNIVNQGMNPMAFSSNAVKEDQDFVVELFEKIGKVSIVDESKIEAYAVICAMGSTYFWFQLQQLKELAVEFGLDEAEANKVIKTMLKGSMETLFDSELTKDEVMNLVPVKPLGEYEETIKGFYDSKLREIFAKIRP